MKRQFNHIADKHFQASFESECWVREKNVQAFCGKMQKLSQKFAEFGGLDYNGIDKSILNPQHIGDWPTEIRNPVLPAHQAMEVAERVFDIIGEYGYTNETCGLHFNFSPICTENFNRVNPFFLARQPIWEKIKADFGRGEGTVAHAKYCKPMKVRQDILDNPPSILDQKLTWHGSWWDKFRGEEANTKLAHENAKKNGLSLWRYMSQMQDYNRFGKNVKIADWNWHYAVLNFTNCEGEPNETSRMEVRGFGNTNYQFRINDVVPYVDEILWLVKESYNHPIKIKQN